MSWIARIETNLTESPLNHLDVDLGDYPPRGDAGCEPDRTRLEDQPHGSVPVA